MDFIRTVSQKYRAFLKITCCFLLLFAFSSCSDSGCIEADDFGEYETQVLEVLASSNSEACNFDSGKPMTDSSQGSGLKTCIISGSVTIYDETGVSQTSSSGCKGLPSPKFQNLCVNQCISDCNVNLSSPGSLTAEPTWKATSIKKNGISGGVTLRPNSEIKIRATGAITLGDKFEYPEIFVKSDSFMPQSFNDGWSNRVIDLNADKMLTVSFSGQVNDGSSPNGGTTPIGKVGAGSATDNEGVVFNASRRLVAYLITHPVNYDFDNKQSNEKAGSINVPLLPDPNLWECVYKGVNIRESSCQNKSYQSNGYPLSSDALVNQVFPLTSAERSGTLGYYGGMVRWSNDGLEPDQTDPFDGVDCRNTSCEGAGAVSPDKGRIVGDLSNDVAITSAVAAKVSFRNLLTNADCDGNLEVVVRSSSGDISAHTVSVKNASWSSEHISVEVGQQILVKQNPATYTDGSGNSASCGRAMAVKFAKYHDIMVGRSGLVSFAILGAMTGGSCNINARIVNPQGSHTNINASFLADFYEYGNFLSNEDPLNNFAVPALASNSLWDSGSIDAGSKKVFVRKGQVIRFSPESWNKSWDSSGGPRECGIGMAMRIDPRPALLCRGYGVDEVKNPKCLSKYNNGNLIGCEETASECFDSQHISYCPNQECYKPVTCTDGDANSNPKYTRTNCSLGSLSAACKIQAGSVYSQAQCDSCSDLRMASALQSPFVDQPNVSFCYDLENYRGRVSNIPITGFTSTLLGDDKFAKGAKELGAFNGTYGNLVDYKNSGLTDKKYNNNIIFTVNRMINIPQAGRLKFIFLDGDNFKDTSAFYGDNNSSGSSYNGSSGFKVNLASYLDFMNGSWLEAILCSESSATSVDCRNNTIPVQMADQPEVVKVEDPIPGDIKSRTKTAFNFDDYGTLIRIKAPTSGSGECVNALIGDVYYCHSNQTLDPTLIKLSFKIRDPENATCDIQNPSRVIDKTADNQAPYDGILINNSKYRPSDCDVSNPQSKNPAVRDGISILGAGGATLCKKNTDSGLTCDHADKDCTREFICADKYSNNSGKYYVTVRVKNPGSSISRIVNDVVTPVIEVMDGSKDGTKIGQAERIYRLIIGDARYQAILSMCLIIMFSFYGVTYLMGITDASISDLISRVVKIGLIYLFVGPEGWTWFNEIVVKFFKNGTDYLSFLMASSFDDSPELKNAINNYDFYDKSILFKSVDNVFSLLFSSAVQKKISGLLFASIFGFLYLLIIFYAIVSYVFAVSAAILLYLTAQVFISVLFVLGPLFFVFTLFGPTKEMFDKWLQQLIGFSLQQIFLLTTLAFFNMMMYEIIKMALSYKVCWDEVWTINIITRISLMSFWTIPSLPPGTDSQIEVGNIGKNDGIPSFFSILFIWVVAKLMHEFVDFMTGVAADIGGGLSVAELGGGIRGAVNGLMKTASDGVGEAWKNSGGKAVARLDKGLFDSGALAKEDRKIKKQQAATDSNNKAAMSKAGRAAINDFKSKNGAELAGLSKEDQERMLRKVKDDAMNKTGEKLGLNPKEIERLKNQKGLQYSGDNLIVGGLSAMRQSARGGNAIFSTIKDQSVSADLTKKQAKEALKNTDEEGAKKFMDSVNKGEIFVESGRISRMKAAPGNAIKAAKEGLSNVGKKFHDPEEDKAIKTLVAAGQIDKVGAGGNWTRSDADKKRIRDEVKKNRTQGGTVAPKMSKASTVASLQMEKEFIQASKDKGALAGIARESGVVGAVIGRKKLETFSDAKKDAVAAVKESRLGHIQKSFESQRDSAQSDIEVASASIKTNQAKIDTLQKDEPFQKDMKEMQDLAKESASKATTPERRREINSRMSEISSDKTYNEKGAQLKAAHSAIASSSSKLNNATAKKESSEEAIGAITQAREIMQDAGALAKIDKSDSRLTDSDRSDIATSAEASKKFDQIMSSSFDDNSVDKIKEFSAKYSSLKGKSTDSDGV